MALQDLQPQGLGPVGPRAQGMNPYAKMALMGTTAGALGGLGSLFGGAGMWGKKGGVQRFPTVSPQQEAALNQLLSQGMSNANWGPIEDRARMMFETKTVPTLAERFTAMGGEGGQRTGEFKAALGQSAADLESQLAALRSQFGLNQLGMGLSRNTFENIMMPRKPGFFEQGLGTIASLLPVLAML